MAKQKFDQDRNNEKFGYNQKINSRIIQSRKQWKLFLMFGNRNQRINERG